MPGYDNQSLPIQQQYNALYQSHKDLSTQYAQLSRAYDELASKYKKLFEKHDQTKVAAKQLAAKYEKVSSDRTILGQHVVALQKENDALRAENDQLRQRINSSTQGDEQTRADVAKAKEALIKAKEIYDSKMAEVRSLEQQKEALTTAIAQQRRTFQEEEGIVNLVETKRSIEQEHEDNLSTLKDEKRELENEIRALKRQVKDLNDEVFYSEFDLYEPVYALTNSAAYKAKIDSVRAQEKTIISELKSAAGKNRWKLNGSVAEGRKMVKDIIKLAFRIFNNECDGYIKQATFSNTAAVHERIDKSCNQLNDLVAVFDVEIPDRYRALKHDEATLEYEYKLVRKQEQEDQRAERERIKEEKRAQEEMEAKRQELELEKQKVEQELARLAEALVEDPGNEDIKERLEELDEERAEIEHGIEDVDYREANKKAGYVYIISNIGVFGDGVYKIGMTRRLDPMERIKELSGASVPFPFDVHALIFSDDAPALEAALHNDFDEDKVNLVNPRKEFYRCDLENLKKAVLAHYDKTVDFTDYPVAEEWRESEKIRAMRAAKSDSVVN